MANPLVTFVLCAYNQERFICEAVAGALAQTYSPLEVVLSDDCSPDRTFEVLQETAAGYRGPHKILLNRNPKNLGVGGHVNRLMELAGGEIIVIAAGDDVSLPQRAERVQGKFAASNGKAMAVFSDMTEIDGNGNFLQQRDARPRPGFDHPVACCRPSLGAVPGCTNAWHRKVFDVFGPLQPEIVFEDRVIDLRAALLGSIRHIPEPLVKYRRHETNLSGMLETSDIQQAQRTQECFLSAFRNRASDLETFIRNVQPDFPEASQCRRLIRQQIGQCQARLRIHRGSPLEMVRGLLGITLNGGSLLQGVKLCRRVLRSRFPSLCP